MPKNQGFGVKQVGSTGLKSPVLQLEKNTAIKTLIFKKIDFLHF